MINVQMQMLQIQAVTDERSLFGRMPTILITLGSVFNRTISSFSFLKQRIVSLARILQALKNDLSSKSTTTAWTSRFSAILVRFPDLLFFLKIKMLIAHLLKDKDAHLYVTLVFLAGACLALGDNGWFLSTWIWSLGTF